MTIPKIAAITIIMSGFIFNRYSPTKTTAATSISLMTGKRALSHGISRLDDKGDNRRPDSLKKGI